MSLMVAAQKGHTTKLKISSPPPQGLGLFVRSFAVLLCVLGEGGAFGFKKKLEQHLLLYEYKLVSKLWSSSTMLRWFLRQENLTWTLSYLIRPLKYRTGTLLATITGSFRDFFVSRFYREDISEDKIFTKQGICRNFRNLFFWTSNTKIYIITGISLICYRNAWRRRFMPTISSDTVVVRLWKYSCCCCTRCSFYSFVSGCFSRFGVVVWGCYNWVNCSSSTHQAFNINRWSRTALKVMYIAP